MSRVVHKDFRGQILPIRNRLCYQIATKWRRCYLRRRLEGSTLN